MKPSTKTTKKFARVFPLALFSILLLGGLLASCSDGNSDSANISSEELAPGIPSALQDTPDPDNSDSGARPATPNNPIMPMPVQPADTPPAPDEVSPAVPIAVSVGDKNTIVITTYPHKTANGNRDEFNPFAYFVGERRGVISGYELTYNNNSYQTSNPYYTATLDITDDVVTGSERGLLGMTFSPDGDWLYIMYSAKRYGGDNVLEAVPVRPLTPSEDGTTNSEQQFTFVEDERVELMRIDQPFSNHNGGDIHFSPIDGYLYIALGDGGGANDTLEHGQNPQTLLGSILRINPEPQFATYTIPEDNPFVPGGGRNLAGINDGVFGAPEVWAYGLRNPWRISFDDETGDLWIADVGQNDVEEITLIPAKASDASSPNPNWNLGWNLGWSYYEGSRAFRTPIPPNFEHLLPVFEYRHDQTLPPSGERRCSIIGGHIYTAITIPKLRGKYLYADYCEEGIIRAYDPLTGEGDIFVIDMGDDLGFREQIITFGRTNSGETLFGTESGTYLLIETDLS